MTTLTIPNKLCVKQVADMIKQGQSTLHRWKRPWLVEGAPGKKRGPRPYQPDGPKTALFYLEHEVLAYLDPALAKAKK